jgi:uncharacterized protein
MKQDGRRFLVDRMLGTLTRYLRFMGYDTLSANSLPDGNSREDTLLLEIAEREGRLLLTRDRELARRGGDRALYIPPEDIIDQIRLLTDTGLIMPVIRMNRCSVCNECLRPATAGEIRQTEYAPRDISSIAFFWCPTCRKLYWLGSHSENLTKRLLKLI